MYPNSNKNLYRQYTYCRLLSGKVPLWSVWTMAMFLLIASGLTYRILASKIVNTSISLPVPLSRFPLEINNWVGTELSIPTTTREYMEKNFADDYLSRRYVNNISNGWVDLYIVYCSTRPGGMLGHQPSVCYPGNGWVHDSTDESYFTINQGQKVNCLIHRFHKPQPSYAETIILNFYIVNGELSTDQRGFTGFSGRKINIARNPARYVAQVQISSIMENSIRTAAEDMADIILDFLPDENGSVNAFEKYGHY
jgi:hypothetical protein